MSLPREETRYERTDRDILESCAQHALEAREEVRKFRGQMVPRLVSVEGAVQSIKLRLDAIEHRLTPVETPPLGMLSQYDPELTPAGGMRIAPEAWAQVTAYLDAQERASKEADAIARYQSRVIHRLKVAAAIASPALAALGWLAHHLLP